MRQGLKDWFRAMTWKKGLMLSLLAILIVAVIIVAFFIYRTIINPKAAFSNIPDKPVETSQDPAETAIREEFSSDRVNILLLGMDSNEERLESEREDFRTDTMLLVSIDFSEKSVDMITVPRDSYVTVTNATGSLYKVNSAAYFGGGMCDSGFLNACDTISGVFGNIPVNYYVAVDMDGLHALVDAIGGIYYDVDVDTDLDGITLTKGYQCLSSDEVLTYCRVRKGIGTDIDRQERQQKMLVAIFQQLKSNGKLEDIPEIYRSIKDMVYTNLSFEQICALAVFSEGFDDLDDIGRYVLKGEYHWAYEVYFYLLDQQDKVDLVKEVLGYDISIDQKHDLYYVLEDSPEDSGPHESDEEEVDEPTPTPDESSEPTDEPTPGPDESSEPTDEPSATISPDESEEASPSAAESASATG